MMARLGDVCAKITDGSHNPPQGISCSEYLMLSSKNIYDDDISFDDPRYLSKENYETENKRTQISAGDILLTIVGTVGRAAVVSKTEKKICLQRSVAVIKPKQELIDSRFLMYQLQSMRTHLEQEARGVAQKGIYLRQVENLQIKVPSRGEQLQVVSNLDQISELISLRKQQLAKLDELVKSRFIELFGDQKANPFGWPQTTIGDCCTLKSGTSLPADKENEGGRIPYVKVGDMNYPGNEQYITTSSRFVTEQTAGAGIFPVGTVIFPKRGGAIGTNKKRLTTLPICADLNVMGVTAGNALKSQYLMAYFNMVDLGALDNGSSVPQINNKDIAPLVICLPPLALQEQFAAFVEQTDKSKLVIQESLAELETLKKALMQKYFG